MNYFTSSDPHPDILFRHSIWLLFWHSFLHFIWHTFWHSVWHMFWHSIWHSFWPSIWHTFWHSFWDMFCHSIWHSFWHSIWHSFWDSFWHCVWHSLWHVFRRAQHVELAEAAEKVEEHRDPHLASREKGIWPMDMTIWTTTWWTWWVNIVSWTATSTHASKFNHCASRREWPRWFLARWRLSLWKMPWVTPNRHGQMAEIGCGLWVFSGWGCGKRHHINSTGWWIEICFVIRPT